MISFLPSSTVKRSKFMTLLFMFLIFGLLHQVNAQNVRITGTVTSADGEGLPGVSVLVKGTSSGSVTDADGGYVLEGVPSDAILVFSFVGMESKEEAINGRSVINVTLSEDLKLLQEIVVVGYGVEQRKEAVTGSVASIGGDEVRAVPSANITQALKGRLPGVELTQTSSRPGATNQIRIRGTRSLTASNDPLIVLDGIPFAGSINDIDPNNIKSIDVLKDASATAIYGARGANGVILVTSNRGRKGEKAQISYNTFLGTKKVFSKYPMMDGPELTKMREVAAATAAEIGGTNYYGPSSDEVAGTNTDWQDLLYRNGQIMSHDIGITQGTEKGNYSFGVGYFKDQSVLPTNQYQRTSLRAAVDQQIGEYVRFGLTSNNSYGFTQGNQVGIASALGASPLSSPYDANGNLKLGTFASTQQDFYKVWTKELVEEMKDLWLSETKSYGTYNSLYGEVEAPWVEGLKYRINVGLNYRTSKGGGFTGKGVLAARDVDLNAPSTASQSYSTTSSWVIENILSYDHTFGKHSINAMLMNSSQQETYEYFRISVQDLPSDHFQYHNLGFAQGEITINPNSGDWNGQKYNIWGLQSYMGRVMYSYDDKYLLTGTIRSDGSSRLAEGNKWHTYPAFSVGWNIARENFMSGIETVDLLKLRIGYGETATQAINPYSTLGALAPRFYNFGPSESGYATGYVLSELPNSNLGWEYTQNWNIGVDFGMFARRLTGTIEYYKQHTKDILLRVNLPATAGVGSYVENIGETENKGIEITINGLIIENSDDGFTLDAGFNFSANRNKLLALASGQTENEGNGWFVGSPINVIYDVKNIGLWQQGDPYLDILEPGGNVGMIKVEYLGDYNSDGTPVRAIGADDRQVQDFNPKFYGGFNVHMGYKKFELNIVGAYRAGGALISTLYGSSSYLNLLNGRHNNVSVDYWTPENTGAKYPRPGGANANDNLRHASTLAYFNGSYTKIRTITLSYNFSDAVWLKKAGISRLRIYATAENPFVLFSPYHKETGMDPEPNSFGDENQAVTTTFQSRFPVVGTNVPTTRNYLIGLNLTF